METMYTVPRMRGINECYRWLKEQDPESKITKYGFRSLVNNGTIPSARNGRRILIDLNMLPEYLKRWTESLTLESKNLPEQSATKEKEQFPEANRRHRDDNKYGQIRVI